MRPLFVAFLVLAMPCIVKAQQSIAPSVNNLVGIDSKLSDAFIATSIGEPAITTLKTDKGFITQGFLQPELLPCPNLEFKYWPNPTIDIVHIQPSGCEVKIASMEILDLRGLVITTVVPKDNSDELNLGDLAQGVYLVKVKLTNDDVHTISVVKTSN